MDEFAHLIRLRRSVLEAEGTFGFYETKEGRSFLRSVFPAYLVVAGFQEGKVAEIISDENRISQEIVTAQTRAALKRWKRGQGELWSGDEERSMVHMRRLETLLMTSQAIREVMEDQARSVYKLQAGEGLGVYVHAPTRMDQEGDLSSRQLRYDPAIGPVFEEFATDHREDLDPDRATGVVHHFTYVKDRGYHICHVIEAEWLNDSTMKRITQHYAGFAFIKDRQIFRFLFNVLYPGHKIQDTFRPAGAEGIKSFNGEWLSAYNGNESRPMELDTNLRWREDFFKGMRDIVNKTSVRTNKLVKYINSQVWNIPV